MKKFILILTLAAFACSPMMVPTAQAAQKHSVSAKGKKHHKKHKKHKKHGKKGA
jgi:hypothetical protein